MKSILRLLAVLLVSTGIVPTVEIRTLSGKDLQPEQEAFQLSAEHLDAVNRKRRIVVNHPADGLLAAVQHRVSIQNLMEYELAFTAEEGNQIDAQWWSLDQLFPMKARPMTARNSHLAKSHYMGGNIETIYQWARDGINVARVYLQETKKRGLECFYWGLSINVDIPARLIYHSLDPGGHFRSPGNPQRSYYMRKLVVGVAVPAAFVMAIVLTVGTHAQEEGRGAVVVFVEGSTVSSFSGSGGTWGSNVGGTTEPQTIEVMKQLRRFCPGVRITADRSAADFLILHERQAGGTFGGNRNNVAAFGKDDMLIYADGATKLDNSIKDLCESQAMVMEKE